MSVISFLILEIATNHAFDAHQLTVKFKRNQICSASMFAISAMNYDSLILIWPIDTTGNHYLLRLSVFAINSMNYDSLTLIWPIDLTTPCQGYFRLDVLQMARFLLDFGERESIV